MQAWEAGPVGGASREARPVGGAFWEAGRVGRAAWKPVGTGGNGREGPATFPSHVVGESVVLVHATPHCHMQVGTRAFREAGAGVSLCTAMSKVRFGKQ